MKPHLFLALAGLLPLSAWGCGLSWTTPTNHFDGVEEHGFVSYWETVAKADVGDNLTIPLSVNFNSNRQNVSPYLGKGWFVPLLESHVEPVDENAMKVIMPDGWIFTFLRNNGTDTWRGNAGWVGETKDTIFTIKAPCGWSIKYDQGKIQEITSDKGRVFSYQYNGKVAMGITEGSNSLVKVDADPKTGAPDTITIGGQKIGFDLADRPHVYVPVLGQKVITGFDSSLADIQKNDGSIEHFGYTLTKTLDPTLSVETGGKTRVFEWEPATNIIISDNDWVYKTEGRDNDDHSKITRVGAKGVKEFWDYNRAEGQETTVQASGKKIVREWFTSGILRGKVRKETEVQPSGKSFTDNYAYDETGKLIRELQSDGTKIIYTYDAADPTTFTKTYSKANGQTYKYVFNKGLLIKKELNGLIADYAYDSLGNLQKTVLSGQPIFSQITPTNGGNKK